MTVTYYYDFRCDNTPCGYFELADTGAELHMNAHFEINGKLSENLFAVRYVGDVVTAYRVGEGAWRTTGLISHDHYPSAAYVVLLRHLGKHPTYIAVDEGKGTVLGETELRQEGDVVREIRAGRVVRTFTVENEQVTAIDWGGCMSRLCHLKADAVRGTRFAADVS